MRIDVINRRLKRLDIDIYDIYDREEYHAYLDRLICCISPKSTDYHIIVIRKGFNEHFSPMRFASYHQAYRYFKPYLVKRTLF